MYLDFLSFISFIKKNLVEKPAKMYGILLGILFSSLVGAILSDIFLPWNYLINLVRCLIALTLAGSLFLLTLCLSMTFEIGKTSKLEKLSTLTFRQRVNLAIILLASSFILFILLANATSKGYTTLSGLLFSSWTWLGYFVKPSYDEVKSEEYGYIEYKDLEEVIEERLSEEPE